MEKDDVLTTKFTEDDADDFNMDALGNNDQNKDDSQFDGKNDDSKSDSQVKDDSNAADKKAADDKKIKDDSSKDDNSDNSDESDKDDKSDINDKSKKDSDKNDSDKKDDGKDKKTDASTDFDIFSDYKSDTSVDDKTDFDYESTATELGIEIEGEKPKSKKEFIELVKNTIEKSKQTLNLDEYPPEVKLILDNLKKNGNLSVTDWYRNETIRNADAFLSLSDDQKVRAQLRMELKNQFSGEDLNEAIEDKIVELTDQEKKDRAKEASRNVTKVRNVEYDKIIKEKGEWIKTQENRDRERVVSEQKILINKIQGMKDFMGFPIPENVTKSLVREIETGAFQKILDENVADSKINAYLFAKLGQKINEGIKRKIDIEKSDSYKKGTDSITKIKHNITSKSTGQQLNKRTSNDLAFDNDIFEE